MEGLPVAMTAATATLLKTCLKRMFDSSAPSHSFHLISRSACRGRLRDQPFIHSVRGDDVGPDSGDAGARGEHAGANAYAVLLMIVRAMVVLVMFVVMMPMLVLHGFVKMFVLVPFSQVQPKPDTHE